MANLPGLLRAEQVFRPIARNNAVSLSIRVLQKSSLASDRRRAIIAGKERRFFAFFVDKGLTGRYVPNFTE